MHMHILLFASLRKRITIHGKPAIKDKEVELANQTLLDLSRLVNHPTSLLSCVPTSERGSSEKRTDYDVREYPVYKAASRLIKSAKGGIWDLVVENRSQSDEPQKQDPSSDDSDYDRDDGDDPFTSGRRGVKRKSTGRPVRDKEEKGSKREAGRSSKRMRHRTSSPLTPTEDDGEEKEYIKVDAWPLLGWLVDLWTRVQYDSKGMNRLRASYTGADL